MVGVLIVNLNNLALTKNCIDTLNEQTNKNFKIYLFDQNSNEVGTATYLDECEANDIIVYRNSRNIPLNHIWNNFKKICDCKYLCFLNNDVEVSNNFIDDTIKILETNPIVGIVIHVTNNPKYMVTNKTLEYKIFDVPRYQGWDWTIRRELMSGIPTTMQIFGGDDYMFAKIHSLGYRIAMAFSSPVIHYKERTRVNVPNIIEIQQSDGRAFQEIMKIEGLQPVYSTLDDGLSLKYPQPNMKIINQ